LRSVGSKKLIVVARNDDTLVVLTTQR